MPESNPATIDNNGTLHTRNPLDVPGWFSTSTADQVYYFLAILGTTTELKPVYTEYVELIRGRKSTLDLEARLMRSLKVDRDLLITYQLDKARTWYEAAPEDAFARYAGAVFLQSGGNYPANRTLPSSITCCRGTPGLVVPPLPERAMPVAV